jgi:hypothetical protein
MASVRKLTVTIRSTTGISRPGPLAAISRPSRGGRTPAIGDAFALAAAGG